VPAQVGKVASEAGKLRPGQGAGHDGEGADAFPLDLLAGNDIREEKR
jgi:hypothetical protein